MPADAWAYQGSFNLLNPTVNLRGHLYNSNFNLYVIELNSTDIATDDDIRSGMVTWVKLFKATTWEGARYPGDICLAPTEVKRRHQDDH